MSAVSFRDVSKSFGDLHALENVSFDVSEGQIFGVVGTSGAGKSTLIRTVNGLEKPTSGAVEVLGVEPAALGSRGLRELRSNVSMVFQHYNLLTSRTVADNVGMPLVLAGVGKAEIQRRVRESLDVVGLSDRAGHYPRQLSGGQQQRVGIARALVTNPKILLCDEPTSALDPLTTAQILDLIVDINAQLGLTVIIITHQMDVVAKIADSVAVLEHGRLIEHGEVEEVFSHPRAPLTRKFVETVVPTRLPESVVADIVAGRAGTVIRMAYREDAARLLLTELSESFGVTVQLLHATEAPLRRTRVGNLVLGLDGERAVDAASWANEQDGLDVEVLS
ncbi:methionine ABC transporter ATP-binding protein [Corynebacterium pacaense]|uniref:methionine ABC transporter ATP-binding protein n=1 Tax=Corynebacterium pacaense TaxID=1816684 RepID=UPI0009BC724A|nr:methionine ABC transporter ATP-binding protein [Corynebacterium pacaense]